ncbi:hypothetical protein [Embleya sp. NPDC050493]
MIRHDRPLDTRPDSPQIKLDPGEPTTSLWSSRPAPHARASR